MFVGASILAVAGIVWISADYPDVNPFQFGGVFAGGWMVQLKSVANWLFVVVIAIPGLFLFQFGRGLFKK